MSEDNYVKGHLPGVDEEGNLVEGFVRGKLVKRQSYAEILRSIAIGLIVGGSSVFLASFFIKDADIKRELRKRCVTTEVKLENLMGNGDGILEPNEIRKILNSVGYNGVVDGSTNIALYSQNPNISSTGKTHHLTGEVFRRGNTIYIPLSEAERILGE